MATIQQNAEGRTRKKTPNAHRMVRGQLSIMAATVAVSIFGYATGVQLQRSLPIGAAIVILITLRLLWDDHTSKLVLTKHEKSTTCAVAVFALVFSGLVWFIGPPPADDRPPRATATHSVAKPPPVTAAEPADNAAPAQAPAQPATASYGDGLSDRQATVLRNQLDAFWAIVGDDNNVGTTPDAIYANLLSRLNLQPSPSMTDDQVLEYFGSLLSQMCVSSTIPGAPQFTAYLQGIADLAGRYAQRHPTPPDSCYVAPPDQKTVAMFRVPTTDETHHRLIVLSDGAAGPTEAYNFWLISGESGHQGWILADDTDPGRDPIAVAQQLESIYAAALQHAQGSMLSAYWQPEADGLTTDLGAFSQLGGRQVSAKATVTEAHLVSGQAGHIEAKVKLTHGGKTEAYVARYTWTGNQWLTTSHQRT